VAGVHESCDRTGTCYGVGVIGLNGPRKMDDRYLGDLGGEFRRGKGGQSMPLPNTASC
jgi:hypothetical protein